MEKDWRVTGIVTPLRFLLFSFSDSSWSVKESLDMNCKGPLSSMPKNVW